MPKIDFTTDEITSLMNCIDTEMKSAKRAQNSGKTPHIKEVYRIHEQHLNTLLLKVSTAK